MLEKKSHELFVFLLALICTFFWGIGYPILKIACESWNIETSDIAGKLLFAGTRFTIAGLILICIDAIKNKRIPILSKKELGSVSLLGLCQTTLQYAFLYIGMANTTGAKGSVLNQLCVFLTVILTPIFFKNEKNSLKKIVGCIIGFCGIIILNINGFELSIYKGDVIVLFASCATTAGYLLSKAMPSDSDAIVTTGYQQLIGGLVLVLIGLVSGGRISCHSIKGWLCFIYLIMECAVAFSVWFYLLVRNDPSKIAVYKFLTPVFGVLFSGLLLGEKIITLGNILSLVFVCFGVVIVNGHKKE